MAYCYLIIDTINGVTVRNYGFSISQIYKTIYLIFVLLWLVKNRVYVPIYILIGLLILIYIHLFYSYNNSDILRDLILANKFFTSVSSYYFFQNQLIINPNNFRKIKKLFFISFFVLIINLIIGTMGFGYASYGEAIGTKGLFYSGNETSLVFIIISLFLLSYLQIKESFVAVIITSGIIFITGAIIITKTAIIGSIMIIILLPFVNIIFNKSKFSIKQVIIVVTTMVLFSSLYINFLLYSNQAILRYNKYINGKYLIAKVYETSRYDRRAVILKSIDNAKINEIIFGRSYYGITELNSTEIDYMDVFNIFGIYGLFIIYGFYLIVLITTVRKILLTNNQFAVYNIFGIILILGISSMAGHVVMSGLAAILLGAYLALPFVKNENIR